MWHTEIVELLHLVQGQQPVLTDVLNLLTADGWAVRYVLPNGLNRWTVIAEKVPSPQTSPGEPAPATRTRVTGRRSQNAKKG